MKSLSLFFLAAPFLLPLFRISAQQAQRVELRCHRTANEDVPENTLESLEQAALLGCDVVEIDLRRTLDGKIVLNHDGFLERLTDGHGEVESTFYDDLRMRDAGGWMSFRFTGLHIPLFEDALRLARRRNIRLFLDMKDKGMGAQVLSILRREDMLDQAEFGGEWDDVKKFYPRANHADASTEWLPPDVTAAQIQKLHQSGKRVIVNFSANRYEMDLAEMRAAVAAGADGINVDFPRLGADAVGRPAEQRIHVLLEEANEGTGDVCAQAILELSRYRGFPLEQEFEHWLLDPDSSASRAAALALVEYRPAPKLSVFAAALHASDSAPRVNAAWALGVLHGTPMTVLPLLKDRDANVVSETLVALAHMPGSVSAQELLPLLHHPDPAVRGAAAVALSIHQPSTAAPAITAQLRREAAIEEAVYRRHAANGGGPFSQAEIAELVAEYRCQMQMLRALHTLQEKGGTRELEAEAFGPDNQFPEPNGAVAALMLWDHLPIDPAGALKELASKDTQAADRAEWALINAGPDVLPGVRKALLSKAPRLQLRAIRILGWQGDAASLDSLRMIEAGRGPNSSCARWAIEKIHDLVPALWLQQLAKKNAAP